MKNKGFSLLELLIAVVILSTMATVGTLAMRERIKRNELIRIRSGLPSIVETVSLKSYELNLESAMTINSNSIAMNVTSSAVTYTINSNIYTFSTSPAGISNATMNSMGAFSSPSAFDIILLDDDATTALTFQIRSNPDLGVYSLEVVE